jgi:hypothetical protein
MPNLFIRHPSREPAPRKGCFGLIFGTNGLRFAKPVCFVLMRILLVTRQGVVREFGTTPTFIGHDFFHSR